MNSTQWTIPPSARQAPDIRIAQLDILRGLAVLGIYWINIVVFAMPSGSYALPTMIGEAEQANLLTWILSELFVEGTMRGLFSLLFGASAMVFLNEAKLAGGNLAIVDRYYRRTLLLIAFGLVHAYLLLWPYDVLYAYGLLGMFLFPLRKLSGRVLIVAGCILLLLGDFESDYADLIAADSNTSMTSQELRETANAFQGDTPEEKESVLRETMALQKEVDMETYQSGYYYIFVNTIADVVEQQSTEMYTTHIFDIGGMMLLGMAFLKLGIISGQRSMRFYLVLAILGYIAGLITRGINIYTEIEHSFSILEITQYTHITYNFGRVPMTIGHIGLIGAICKWEKFTLITRSLAATGRLALTNYIMQTVISIFLFYGFGFALFAEFERYQLIYICFAVWSFQILFSILWLKYFRYGPLEWLWRSLIYLQRQPFRNQKAS